MNELTLVSPEKPAFSFGFAIARRLREPSFRNRLRACGKGESVPLVPATYEESVRDLVDRMTCHANGLILIEDDSEPEGVRLIWWEKR